MAAPKLDVSKLVSKARASTGAPAAPSVAMPGDSDEGADYSAGDRAIAAMKHGDGEAFEQAILDILAKAP